MNRRVMLAALVSAIACTATGEAAAERYLVVFKSEQVAEAAARQAIEAAGGDLMRVQGDLGVAQASSSDPEFAANLRVSSLVESVSVDVLRDTQPGDDRTYVADIELPPNLAAPGVAGLGVSHHHGHGPGGGSGFVPPFVDPALLTQTFFYPFQWDVQKFQMDAAWALGYAGDPRIKVAVLSSGIDYTHLDLAGRVDLALSKNFVPEDAAMVQALFPGMHEILDLGLHGTYTASLISCNAFVYSCDTPNVDLIGLKWLNFEERGRIGDLVAAIDYATRIRVHILAIPDTLELFDVQLDWSDPVERAEIKAVRRAIAKAEAHGMLVLTGAWTRRDECGFDADHTFPLVHFPGQMGGTTVAATGLSDQWSAETSYGYSLVDIAAPGGELIPETCRADPNVFISSLGVCGGFTQHVTPRNNFPELCNQQTTPVWIFSFGVRPAVAHTAATAVVLLQRYGPNTNMHFIRHKLFHTADDVIDPGFDRWSGWGRVNALKAATE